MKSFIKILVVTIVILGLCMPLLRLGAEEIQPTKSQLLEEIGGLVDDLVALKDNKDSSEEEKAKQEAAIRKEALSKILELSMLEIKDLKEKLNSLELDNENSDRFRNQLLILLEGYKVYYQDLKAKLTEELTLDELKKITKDFKQWRNNNYDKNIPVALNFILVFSTKSALDTANLRLEKITSDLTKLENAKLIKKQNLQGLLNAAMQHLTRAHLLNKKAKDLLSITVPSTLMMNPLQEITATSTNEKEIKSLIKESLQELKTTYKSFLEISKKVKQQLGL